VSNVAFAGQEPPKPAIGISEKLGDFVPGTPHFTNENGDSVTLGQLIDRPTIIALVYYTCPSICRPLLAEVTKELGKLEQLDVQPMRDYRMITISFDPNDSPAGSARAKDEYYQQLPKGFPREGWTFLTGDSTNIAQVTQAVGFNFRRTGDMYQHPTTLIVLSPQRKITRYLTGSEYLPLDIKMALVEAKEGRVGATIVKFYKFCFSYDPAGHKYVLNATRVVGASTMIGVAVIVVFVAASGRRRREKKV
jgi:protein SCO1